MSEIKLETIARMRTQRQRLDARIANMESRKKAEERKKDTRRKILAGVYFIKLLGGDLKRLGLRLYEGGYLDERDFSLFQLTSADVNGVPKPPEI